MKSLKYFMLKEILKDLNALQELLRYSMTHHRTLEPTGKKVDFSTPGLSSRWELSFVNNTEETIYTKMMSEFDEGDVFFDVGANIGFYSCLFSEKASKVYSFEPNENAAKLLEKNIEQNSLENVELKQIALSNEKSSKTIAKAPGNSVFGTATVKDDENGKIKARKADKLLENQKIQAPDMIKIDVEGHEKKVLKGMEDLIKKASPVIYVESHNQHQKLEKILEEYDYSYERLNKRLEGNIFYRAQPT